MNLLTWLVGYGLLFGIVRGLYERLTLNVMAQEPDNTDKDDDHNS